VTAFELLLFSTDPETVSRYTEAGVDGFIVDWESKGKEKRQSGADTEINHDTPEDLRRVRASTASRVLCRLNQPGPWTRDEIDEAVASGVDEILLPMVRSPEEVLEAIRLVAGRCGVGILIETLDAVRHAAQLARLPISRAYVGLNDLSIERRSRSIFEPFTDGLVDGIRPLFTVPFGLAGLTLPECGRPIPCRLLIGEMTRLSCGFSFLRRSWRRDMAGRDPRAELPRIRAAIERAGRRSAEEIARDRAELVETVAAAAGGGAGPREIP
jgi:HpcH/HpaI aldolase/citrate lyase family